MEDPLAAQTKRNLSFFALAVLAAFLGAAGFFVLRTPPRSVTTDRQSGTAPAPGPNDGSQAGVEPERKPKSVSHTVPQTPILSPRSRFERSRDLSRFVLDLKPLLDQNAPSALEAYATARSECVPLSVNPNFADALRNSTERRIPEYMLDDYIERCGALAGSERMTSADLRKLHQRAAEGGDMTALAQQFTAAAPSLAPDQASKMMRDIVASGDPYAISELSTALEANASSNFSPLAGSEMYSNAWQLVACDLGMDCGPRSAIVRNMCLFGGICGPAGSGFREVVSQALLPPQGFQRAEQTEALILQAIENGDYDSLVK